MHNPAEQIALLVDDFLIKLVTTNIDWNAKPSADKWSAKEVMGHLVDSASNNLHRLSAVLTSKTLNWYTIRMNGLPPRITSMPKLKIC